jgi:hypothetical protein
MNRKAIIKRQLEASRENTFRRYRAILSAFIISRALRNKNKHRAIRYYIDREIRIDGTPATGILAEN